MKRFLPIVLLLLGVGAFPVRPAVAEIEWDKTLEELRTLFGTSNPNATWFFGDLEADRNIAIALDRIADEEVKQTALMFNMTHNLFVAAKHLQGLNIAAWVNVNRAGTQIPSTILDILREQPNLPPVAPTPPAP